MSDANPTNHLCPSLGFLDDAETPLAFPSISNYCHRSRPISSPALKYQQEFCLCEKYGECPVFLSQKTTPLPKHIRAPRTIKQRNSFRKNILVSLAALGVVLLLGWGIFSRGIFSAAEIGMETPTPFSTALRTATSLYLPTMTASPLPPPTLTYTATVHALSGLVTDTPTQTPTLYSTATPTTTPSQLDFVFGTDYKFVIHKVMNGETLEQYATQYNTSVEAIRGVNYKLKPIVVASTLLVIPVGFTDFSKIPSFVAYQVRPEDRGLSVASMAKRLRVNPLDLKYYNGWTSDGDRPIVGAFLLVPYPRPAP